MQLDTLSVHGLRSLARVDDIPILSPTVLTGSNDSGKSTVLLAIAVLLDDVPLPDGARGSTLDPADDVVIEGRFTVHDQEQAEVGLPATMRIRRVVPLDGPRRLEARRSVPIDVRLRRLDLLKLNELKDLAGELDIPSPGGVQKAPWLEALQHHADGTEHVDDWGDADPAVVRRLPALLSFDGTNALDAEATVQKAMAVRYREHLEDEDVAAAIAEIEAMLSARVRADADDLCRHVSTRHPDLGTIAVEPSVSLRGGKGLQSTRLTSETAGERLTLTATGSGRARRVSLSVWEWTTGTLASDGPGERDLVVTYDEPDTHLDYERQRTLMHTVLGHCGQRVRTVVTTHSLNLIDGVDPESLVKLSLDERGRTSAAGLAAGSDHGRTDVFLRDITAALGVRNSVLLHERLFVGVEGATEMQALPLLFRLYTGRVVQSYGVSLWPGGNDVGAVRFTAYLVQQGRPVAFVVDEDSRMNQKRWLSDHKLREAGVDPERDAYFLGAPNEFEELFTDEQWAAAANERFPRTDGRPWTVDDVHSCRDGKFSGAWQHLVSDASGAPVTKPDLAVALASTLHRAEDLPLQLRTVFDALIARVQ